LTNPEATTKNSRRDGHWLDRLPAIDEDIVALERKLEQTESNGAPPERIRQCIQETLGRSRRATVDAHHTVPPAFRGGQPLEIELALEKQSKSVRMYYRRVDQAERYETALLEPTGNRFHAVIPSAYTDSPYALQYYFEVEHDTGGASLYPGFEPDLANQPYFVVRQS
jgi:hypothetical protein